MTYNQSLTKYNFSGDWKYLELGRENMKNLSLKLFMKMQSLLVREEGQDLVEYALVVALVAFGTTVAMQTLGSGLNAAFTQISSTLASSLT